MQGNILFDYLKATFTLPELLDSKSELIYPSDCNFYIRLLEILGFEDKYIESTNGGIHGYRFTTTIGEFIKIRMSGPKNKSGYPTHLLEMSGQACRDFEEHNGNWRTLLDHLFTYECNFTRIDIANDLIDYKLFNIGHLLKKIEDSEYITPRFNKKTIMKSDKVNETETPGVTITFGSRQSEAVLQIYDKKAEQKSRNIAVSCNTWIRFELRYYKDKAFVFIGEYLKKTDEELPKLFSSVLADSISFLDPPVEDTTKIWSVVLDKRSWKTCKWWDEHIGNVKKIRIRNQNKLETTISENLCWLESSVSKMLMRVAASLGPDKFEKFMKKLLTTKLSELTKKDLSRVNHYRLLNNLSEFDYNEMVNEVLRISNEIEKRCSNDTE